MARHKQLVEKNIKRLQEAKAQEDCQELHKTYNKMIHKLCLSFNVRLNKKDKITFCKKCFVDWPQYARVRKKSSSNTLEYHCKSCGYIKRFGMTKKNFDS